MSSVWQEAKAHKTVNTCKDLIKLFVDGKENLFIVNFLKFGAKQSINPDSEIRPSEYSVKSIILSTNCTIITISLLPCILWHALLPQKVKDSIYSIQFRSLIKHLETPASFATVNTGVSAGVLIQLHNLIHDGLCQFHLAFHCPTGDVWCE